MAAASAKKRDKLEFAEFLGIKVNDLTAAVVRPAHSPFFFLHAPTEYRLSRDITGQRRQQCRLEITSRRVQAHQGWPFAVVSPRH